MTYTVTPIGTVDSPRSDPSETDHWGDVISRVVIDERLGDQCLAGLGDFSHAEVVFLFDQVDEETDFRSLRRPRGRADMPEVGVFAARGPRRPNRIGVTICEILAVDGRVVQVRGLDAVAGTPVLDIKPVLREFLPTEVRQPRWAEVLMQDYFKPSR